MRTLQIQTDRTLVRASGRSVRHALVSFAAPEAPHAGSREPVNVGFVVDRSGSMGGSKIHLARQAVVQALRMLKDGDSFSVVCFDHEVDVVVPATRVSGEAVRNAVAQVEQLQARGQTALADGWLRGCEQVAHGLRQGQVARCLLLSDGHANQGETDRETLARHAAELRTRGIATSTFGIGADYDELLLAGMARSSGGNFYYIETAAQIADFLTSELGEALEVTARQVVVTIAATDGVVVRSLNAYPVREEGGRLIVALGDLVSRQDVSLAFRLRFPEGQAGKTARVLVSVADAQGALREPDTDLLWTYADHAANDGQRRNVAVDRVVAALHAARAKAEALELNAAGRFDEARARLEAVARRIEHYAGDDPELHAVIAELRERFEMYAYRMDTRARKMEHFASYSRAMAREADGKARRRPTS